MDTNDVNKIIVYLEDINFLQLQNVCLPQDENQRISHKHRRNLVTSALNKQSKLEKEIARTREILKSPKFWTNAPEDVKLALPKKVCVFQITINYHSTQDL